MRHLRHTLRALAHTAPKECDQTKSRDTVVPIAPAVLIRGGHVRQRTDARSTLPHPTEQAPEAACSTERNHRTDGLASSRRPPFHCGTEEFES